MFIQSKAWAGSDLLSALKCVLASAFWNNHKNFVWQELPCLPKMSIYPEVPPFTKWKSRWLVLSATSRLALYNSPLGVQTQCVLEMCLSPFIQTDFRPYSWHLYSYGRSMRSHKCSQICCYSKISRGQTNLWAAWMLLHGAGPQPSTYWQHFSSQQRWRASL